AGPLIVIDTDVVGAHRSNPEYSRFMSSRVGTLTPELPTLPYTSGRVAGSSPYRVTESNAVDSRAAPCPAARYGNLRLVRSGGPSPANMRVESSVWRR